MAFTVTNSQDLTLALISDTGGPAASGTTFYYNVGSQRGGFAPTNSFGPGPFAVSGLVQTWKPSDVLGIGDLAYNAGGSTIQDISIGQYYNNFIYPYPSPAYSRPPYTAIDGSAVVPARKSWPYNLYDYPNGFPNPVIGGSGGSRDQRNHFWGALGNHDYGLSVGYSQVGVTPYSIEGNSTGNPVGPSSARDVTSFVDYVLPFLENPELLGSDRSRLNVGSVDKSGNGGVYYSISFGGTAEAPLVEFFVLDTSRLNVNSGFEDWNPSGSKTKNPQTGLYENAVISNPPSSFEYDPASSLSLAYPGTTTDPANGYKQFSWLKRSLEASKASWKVIAGHHPVYASGRWGDIQPDDHMSIPYLQKFLNALPEGAFDAYYNGHDHYYERVLESKAGGIGLGIPFITNGNSGRNLEKKIQVPYGVSVYSPTAWDKKKNGDTNPNASGLPYLLDSVPLEVGSSGLAGDGNSDTSSFSNGLYGYGFGATRADVGEGYLLFKYEEARLVDSAIANHIPGGIAPEIGFAETTAEDWIPNPDGTFNGKSDLAQFELTIDQGVVTGVKRLQGGRGYMSSKGGSYVVRGFNIYGNNVDPLRPWEGTAQVDLTFAGGQLVDVVLTDGGRGYELAVKAAADNNIATSTAEIASGRPPLVVALDYNLNEIQYLVRDNDLYSDWYLIAETAIDALAQQSGTFGGLQVSLAPSSKKAQDFLATLPITTGYSGVGAQRAYATPQQGSIQISDRNGTLIAGGTSGPLANGSAALQFAYRPAPGAVNVEFGGDPTSSYLVNFREARKTLNISYGSWSSGISLSAPQTIRFDQDVNLSLIRIDSVAGPISFGLKPAGTATVSVPIPAANGASNAALTMNSIFIPTGANSWLTTESQSLGSVSSSLGRFTVGDWVPVATNGAGQELAIQDIQLSANAVDVTFSGGFRALFNSAGTGTAQSVPGSGQLAVTVQRLGRQDNGLAFYLADPITGAVLVNGKSFLPGDSGYLQAAFESAKSVGLLLAPDRLPGYGGEVVITDLPLNASQNYGILLLRNNNSSDLVSSYSQANAGGAVSVVSFVAPGRGLVYGIEDLPFGRTDSDYNDLIVGVAGANFSLV